MATNVDISKITRICTSDDYSKVIVHSLAWWRTMRYSYLYLLSMVCLLMFILHLQDITFCRPCSPQKDASGPNATFILQEDKKQEFRRTEMIVQNSKARQVDKQLDLHSWQPSWQRSLTVLTYNCMLCMCVCLLALFTRINRVYSSKHCFFLLAWKILIF